MPDISRCDKCGIETTSGDHYGFYYGKETGYSKKFKGLDTIEQTWKYEIEGSANCYFCNRCLLRLISTATRNDVDTFQQLGKTLAVIGLLLGWVFYRMWYSWGGLFLSGCMIIAFLCFPAGLFALIISATSHRRAADLARILEQNDGVEIDKALSAESTREEMGGHLAISHWKEANNGTGRVFFTRSKYAALSPTDVAR